MTVINRPGSSDQINFNAPDVGISREEGRKAQEILEDVAKGLNESREAKLEALTTVLNIVGLRQEIDPTQDEGKEAPVSLTLGRDMNSMMSRRNATGRVTIE